MTGPADTPATATKNENLDIKAEIDRLSHEVGQNLNNGHLYYTAQGKALTTIRAVMDAWHDNAVITLKLNPVVASALTTH